ncbi:MAG: UDP-N-acetylglucosamine 2-epimerase (non-hydrolyzing), partial [Candidatus Methanomethylicus sp.]|nr:UDP-N-acetylglucosamine 2-epimerase (non-hydrolyzing) [Candidatus Methanomethylicus sp.]
MTTEAKTVIIIPRTIPKICIVLGTRPEIIKMSPIIRLLEKESADYFTLHTGQHYSYNMDKIFFEQLQLPIPRYNLNVGSGSHAQETGKMLMGIEGILNDEKPSVILVEGDTNSVLAGALSASKMHIKVGHVEAGLRSRDMSMPEEINRILADHMSDYLFAPTSLSRDNLLKEGIDEQKIFVTGNTVVDALYQHLKLRKGDVKDELQLSDYFLVTLHRQENVDNPERLRRILTGLTSISKKYGRSIVWPIHPRSRKRLNENGIALDPGFRLMEPIDYLTFLGLESQADLILTDSGGVQEEACILGVP